MRMLEDPLIDSFPANSFVATADLIKNKRNLLVRLARAYTMGVVYTLKNTRQAAAIFQEVYPQVVPTGLTPEAALDRTATLLKTVSGSGRSTSQARSGVRATLRSTRATSTGWCGRKSSSSQWMRRRSRRTTWSKTSTENLDIKSAEEASAR